MSAKLSRYFIPLATLAAIGSSGFIVARGKSGPLPRSAEAAALRVAPHPAGPLAATVNGQGITLQKLKARCLAVAGKNALHQIIDETLIDQALKTHHLTVTSVDLLRKELEIQRLSGQSLAVNLRQSGLSRAEFEANLRSQLKLEKLVTLKSQPLRDPRHVWHLTITTFDIDPHTGRAKTRTPAQALLIIAEMRRKLDRGAHFADLAARYSDYEATRHSRGDLGILAAGSDYSANLYQAAHSLQPGQISRQTVRSPAGYELLYVSSTGAHHPAQEDALYQRATQSHRQQQLADAGMDLLNPLRRKAQVTQDVAIMTATVNGQPLDSSAVANRALQLAGAPMLQQLVQSALIDSAAASRHIEVLPADIQLKKTRLTNSLHGQSLEAALQSKGLTMMELESELTEQVKLEKLTNVPLQAPAHLRHVYHLAIAARDLGPSSLPGAPPRPSRAEALKKIQQISFRLAMGASFPSLARQYSDDSFTKSSGGDLGILHDGSTDNPDIVKAALALQRGQFSKPFVSFFGYDIVYVASTGEDHPASENQLYRDAADQFRDTQLGEPARQKLQELRHRAVVNIVYRP